MLPGFEHARANFNTAIVGHLGNWIRYQLERSFRFEQWLDRATRVWGRPTHLVGHYFPSEFARLVAIMRENFARRAHLPPHQARMLRFPVTLGWQSLSFDLAEVFLDISYPFYYRPLMGFAFNLPPAVVVEQKLYDRWCRKVEAEAQTALGGGSMAPTRGPTQATDSRTAVRRVTVLDWPERVGRSLAWLFATVEQHRDDEILRKICLVSLPRYLDGEKVVVPAALQGAAPFLAKRYAERKW